MLVPLSWLKEYVDITLPLEELEHRLTMAGVEIAKLERIGAEWERDKIFVGEIVSIDQHPNADRLVLATVNYGAAEPQRVVTGAPNLKVGDKGQKIPFAVVGAKVIDGHKEDGSWLTIKPAKLRGIESAGMVLSEKELGLSDDHTGIIILPPDAPVGTPLVDYLGDVVLETELTPNLARVANMVGTAREVAAMTGQKVRYPSDAMVAEGPAVDKLARVVIEDPDLCNRYCATVIEGVRIAPSPTWMQRRVTLAGMRSISNIVDVTNYVMLELGQPLHAFDYDKLVERAGGAPPTIIVRRALPGEELVTLDNVTRQLTTEMLLICDTAGPIAIAGVMGGLETEVTASTTRILLEAANFNNINVRQTYTTLKLPSEAASRFGRGIHPALALYAGQRATELMRQIAGGTIAAGVVDTYPVPAPRVAVELATGEVRRILGMDLSAERVVEDLRALEFEVDVVGESAEGWKIRAVVPNHRIDVTNSYDLLEEVARVEGYDTIPETLMTDELPPQRTNTSLELEERVRDILVGAGLQETISYQMTTPEREATLHPGLTPAQVGEPPYIVLANPIRPDRAVMRHTLVASALENLANNARYREHLALFEVGPIYIPREGQELPDEPRRLCIALAGSRLPLYWDSNAVGQYDFYDLKGIIDALLARLGVRGVWAPLRDHPTYHPGRTAQVAIEVLSPQPSALSTQPIGVVGELHPLVREAFNAQSSVDLPDAPILIADLDLETLLQAADLNVAHAAIPSRPPVKNDLAVIVDEGVAQAAVRAIIVQAGGDLLKSVDLFDVYRGPQIGEGKKSLAYALTFQAVDRTLTDETVAPVVQRIVDALGQQLGASIRS